MSNDIQWFVNAMKWVRNRRAELWNDCWNLPDWFSILTARNVKIFDLHLAVNQVTLGCWVDWWISTLVRSFNVEFLIMIESICKHWSAYNSGFGCILCFNQYTIIGRALYSGLSANSGIVYASVYTHPPRTWPFSLECCSSAGHTAVVLWASLLKNLSDNHSSHFMNGDEILWFNDYLQ